MDGASIPDPAKNLRGRRAGAEKVASGLRHQREKALHHSAVWISERIEHGEVIGIGDLLVHRFLGIDHLRWIHVIHDDLYPSL